MRAAPEGVSMDLGAPKGSSEAAKMQEAADFEGWGPVLSLDSEQDASPLQAPLREASVSRLPGTIDVHFSSPSGSSPSEGAICEDPADGLAQQKGSWRHLQLPLETFLFLAVDSEADALRFLKEGASVMLGSAHASSGSPSMGPVGAGFYELKLAEALFTEAAAAAVQRRAAAQSAAPKGKSGFESLKKAIKEFFAALYPRVAEERHRQQKQLLQQQDPLLCRVAPIWQDFRATLFSHDELPPFERVPVVSVREGGPLWDVRRASGVQGAPGKPSCSRKLLLRLPELALHEALLTPLQIATKDAPETGDTAACRGNLALRWAVLCAMVRYREMLDPQVLDLIPDPRTPRGLPDGLLTIGLSAAARQRRLRLLQSIAQAYPVEYGGQSQSRNLRTRSASPLWILPMGSAVKAWMETSTDAAPSFTDYLPFQLTLSQRRQLSSWLGDATRLDLNSLFHAAKRSGAAGDNSEAVALLEGLLLSCDQRPPDLDAMEEQLHRERTYAEGKLRGPLAADSTTAGALLALPAFVEALILDGVDAGARVIAPLMAQLNQQAQSLASQLGLPSADGSLREDDARGTRPSRTVSRAQLLEQRREFLLLLNTVERRMLMAVTEALEGSILGGTGLHARRLSPEPEGPLPEDGEEAAVRTFVEAQVFLRDLTHSMRKTLMLPKGPHEAHAEVNAAAAPVDHPEASIPFPSFSDLLTVSEGSNPLNAGRRTLATSSALATAAARLYAFFQVNCFGRSLPDSLRLRISRGLSSPTAASCRLFRELHDGSLRAEWTIHIHPDEMRCLASRGVSAASSLLSSMFTIYKDSVLTPRALLPPGVPPLEGASEETESWDASSPSCCCKAVRRWQAIRRTAERNAWPFYVGLQGGEPLQFSLATSICPLQEGPGDPALVCGSPRPMLDILSAKPSASVVHAQVGSSGPHRLLSLRTAVPIGSSGSVSAAMALSAAETEVLLREAKNEAEGEKILRALEACTAERYEGARLRTPLLDRLVEEGIEPRRALLLLNTLVERQTVLPSSGEISELMTAAHPETAGSPVVVPRPKVEGALANLSRDWEKGSVHFLPLVYALWAGERSAAAGAAAAGAVSVAKEMGEEGLPKSVEAGSESSSLDTWAWKVAEKLRRDATGAAFLLRWLEGHTRGYQHSSDCLQAGSTGVDLRGVVSQGPSVPEEGSPAATKALFQEGLKYLEDLHVIEHQHQHSQRLMTMHHLLHSTNNQEGLAEAVSQICAGQMPSKTKDSDSQLLTEQPDEAPKAVEETQNAVKGEAALRGALEDSARRIVEGSGRDAVAQQLYAMFNTKCFSRALPPSPQLVFADPNSITAARGTLYKASSPPAVLASHYAAVGDFRQPPVIYIHPGVRDIFLLAHVLLQQMMQLMGRVYQPFTTLGVETPPELQKHITASQLAPLADKYATKLAKAPITPPASDGLQRIQSLARPEPLGQGEPEGFVSLSRFFQASTALPALLRESGKISEDAAAKQQQTLQAAATALARASAKGTGRTPMQHNALHLVAAEAAETASAGSSNPDDINPAAFLEAVEFVQMEAARHYAREGTQKLPVVVAAPGEDEGDQAGEEEATFEKSEGAKATQRNWQALLSTEESIRLVKHALLNKDGQGGTSLLGDLVESGSTSLERGIEILANALGPAEGEASRRR
ncbi:hypothetical protein cyc_07546 [Cyclospora cayetanensis]|uniref:Uncharacterized protein n=1 Tax=Cyclospora cayetanensis TaxID=88456 RepID=A0A1D3D9H9_9EIME|nr:hypothetical protein cyc_07546 [Cyclospora cayetanensis]